MLYKLHMTGLFFQFKSLLLPRGPLVSGVHYFESTVATIVREFQFERNTLASKLVNFM